MQDETIHITVYADERKKLCGRWDYMALLFLPTDQLHRFHASLHAVRVKVGYDGALKYSNLHRNGRGERVRVAEGWADLVLEEARQHRGLFMKILGIDRENLDFSVFGDNVTPKGKYATVYNRFFRSQLVGGLKYFFGGESRIVVDEVIHDSEGNLENHEYFNWHAIMRADREIPNVSFQREAIRFVTSNPRAPDAAGLHTELVQFADIVLGAISQCVECHNRSNQGQHAVAVRLLPLVERMSKQPNNPNSSFGHHRRYGMKWFPRSQITVDATGFRHDALYGGRNLALAEKVSGQGELWGNG